MLLARTAIAADLKEEGEGRGRLLEQKGRRAHAHAHARTYERRQAALTNHKHAHGTQTQYPKQGMPAGRAASWPKLLLLSFASFSSRNETKKKKPKKHSGSYSDVQKVVF